MNYDGFEKQQLVAALAETFPTRPDRANLVLNAFGVDLEDIPFQSQSDSRVEAVRAIIDWGDARKKRNNLIVAAHQLNRAFQWPPQPERSATLPTIPVVVVAMNAEEAKILEDGADFYLPSDLTRFEQLAEALENYDRSRATLHLEWKLDAGHWHVAHNRSIEALRQSYQPKRDDWQPLQYAGQSIQMVIREATIRVNLAREEGNLPLLEVQFLTEQIFSEQPAIVRRAKQQINNKQVLVVVDAISLMHPNIRSKLIWLTANDDAAFCVLSPVNIWEVEANRWIEENSRPDLDGIGTIFVRFDSEWDSRCEFGVGDLRGLQRWFATVVREIKGELEPNLGTMEGTWGMTPQLTRIHDVF